MCIVIFTTFCVWLWLENFFCETAKHLGGKSILCRENIRQPFTESKLNKAHPGNFPAGCKSVFNLQLEESFIYKRSKKSSHQGVNSRLIMSAAPAVTKVRPLVKNFLLTQRPITNKSCHLMTTALVHVDEQSQDT